MLRPVAAMFGVLGQISTSIYNQLATFAPRVKARMRRHPCERVSEIPDQQQVAQLSMKLWPQTPGA